MNLLYLSDLVCMDQHIYSVRHIRYQVDSFVLKRRHRKLLERNDKRFKTKIAAVNLDERAENLYTVHKSRFKGFIHDTLSEIVYPLSETAIKTMQLQVFDGDKLIASSYLDLGNTSAASILCVYDLQYNKESLGIYTMLKELEYLQQKEYAYYYPGYVLDRPSCFDYKLTLGNCQWLVGDNWQEEDKSISRTSVAKVIEERMAELRLRLGIAGIDTQLVYYPYFTLAYLMDNQDHLVKFPCYFLFEIGGQELAASYDFESDDFIVFEPVCCVEYSAKHRGLSDDFCTNHYELRVLSSSYYLPLILWLENSFSKKNQQAIV